MFEVYICSLCSLGNRHSELVLHFHAHTYTCTHIISGEGGNGWPNCNENMMCMILKRGGGGEVLYA